MMGPVFCACDVTLAIDNCDLCVAGGGMHIIWSRLQWSKRWRAQVGCLCQHEGVAV